MSPPGTPLWRLRLAAATYRFRELVEELRRQRDLLLEAATSAPELLPEDRDRILAMAADDSDPAYHGRPDRSSTS